MSTARPADCGAHLGEGDPRGHDGSVVVPEPASLIGLSVLVGGIAYLTALFAPRLAPRVILLALAANLWLAGWWAVALVGLAAAVLPLGVACAAILAAYLLALGLDPEAVALSPFGPSQAGRFYGVSNLLETFLLLPALLGAALLGRLGIAVAALALVAVAGNRFGADGGGLLVLLAAYVTLVLRMVGARIDARRVVLAGAAVVVAGVALVGIDAALGGSSHVTDAVGDGPGAVLADLGDRVELSLRRTFASFGPAFAVLASLPVLAWSRPAGLGGRSYRRAAAAGSSPTSAQVSTPRRQRCRRWAPRSRSPLRRFESHAAQGGRHPG